MNLQKINRKGIAIFMIVRNNFASKQGIIAPFFPAKLNLAQKDRLESVIAVRVVFLRIFKEA